MTISEAEGTMKVNYNYKHAKKSHKRGKQQGHWIIQYSKVDDAKIIIIWIIFFSSNMF